MIQLTFKDLRNSQFIGALNKLATIKLPIKSAYSVAKISKLLKSESKLELDLFIKLVKQYANLDEKGEVKPPEGAQPGTYEVPEEKSEEWKKAIDEHLATPFEINWRNIKLDELEGSDLTAQDLENLEPILEDLPNLEVVK